MARPRAKLLAVSGLLLGISLLRVNTSPSMPRGLYLLLPAGGLKTGSLVLVCLSPPASNLYREHAPEARGSCPDHLPPMLKAIAALGGSTVTFGPEGVAVDGHPLPSSAPLARDRRGLPLPHPPYGTYRLAPGTAWLYAPYDPRSFDSRYFGPVPTRQIRLAALPLLVASSSRSVPAPYRVRPFSFYLL
jgi:conjugative transfer signal peptidase TraF